MDGYQRPAFGRALLLPSSSTSYLACYHSSYYHATLPPPPTQQQQQHHHHSKKQQSCCVVVAHFPFLNFDLIYTRFTYLFFKKTYIRDLIQSHQMVNVPLIPTILFYPFPPFKPQFFWVSFPLSFPPPTRLLTTGSRAPLQLIKPPPLAALSSIILRAASAEACAVDFLVAISLLLR